MGDLTKHFSRWEFACPCGCGFDTVDMELITHLEHERRYFGLPMIVTSGCRCPEYNAKIGGARQSQHQYGRAADTVVEDIPLIERFTYYQSRWPRRYGIGTYPADNMLHFDTRTNGPKRWGDRP